MQMGGRSSVHAQCPGNRIEDFDGGVSVATLLQAHPITFLAFLFAGTGLVLAGTAGFIWATERMTAA